MKFRAWSNQASVVDVPSSALKMETLFLRNVGVELWVCTAPKHTRTSSSLPPWKPQISHKKDCVSVLRWYSRSFVGAWLVQVRMLSIYKIPEILRVSFLFQMSSLRMLLISYLWLSCCPFTDEMSVIPFTCPAVSLSAVRIQWRCFVTQGGYYLKCWRPPSVSLVVIFESCYLHFCVNNECAGLYSSAHPQLHCLLRTEM
jgi:hypothetical protein